MAESDRNERISSSNSLLGFSIMGAQLSSLEDMSSVHYKGRALVSEIADIARMKQESWRSRLAAAIEASGKSRRSISLAAGMAPGYLHSILVEGKDPTISNLLKVCEETGVSMSYILYGYEISGEVEEILDLLQSSSPRAREGLLQILRDQRAS